jgi:molybdopterin/thiamine biosynthesis adenylyltransferase
LSQNRHDRQERFLKQGQKLLKVTKVTVIGVGGLGSHIIQQLAFLGVGTITVVDPDVVEITNLNRLIGAHHNDADLKLAKVDVMERQVREIDPSIGITKICKSLMTSDAFDAVKNADFVFGCVDNDGPRIVLTELCAAYKRPYLDLASEIVPDSPSYGGRVCFSDKGQGCLSCLDQIDSDEAQQYFMSKEQKEDRRRLYGLHLDEHPDSGPSVVTLNGVVASLGTTEFMVHVAGIRQARRLVNYYGHSSKVTVNNDEPMADCYYCKDRYGLGRDANVERYLS